MTMLALFAEYLHDGGLWIMAPIFLVSVVVWFIGSGKLLQQRSFAVARRRFLAECDRLLADPRTDCGWQTGRAEYNELGRHLAQVVRAQRACPPGLIREFLIQVMPDLNRGLNTMASWTAAAPLLGLLGTVVGMIQTFQAITLFGVGNPHFTAEGISIALLTTQAGLTVAFPGLLFHDYLNNRKNRLSGLLFKDCEVLVTQVQRCLSRTDRGEHGHV
jgi:biopolymer transport protein ExbB